MEEWYAIHWFDRHQIEYSFDTENQQYTLMKDSWDLWEHIDQPGIYVIYANHPLYGRESLVYIGMTETTFRKRLQQHLNGRFFFHNEVSIRFGLVYALGKNLVRDKTTLENIESILISCHAPALNRQNIDEPRKSIGKDYVHIYNVGNRGELQQECTSSWFWD